MAADKTGCRIIFMQQPVGNLHAREAGSDFCFFMHFKDVFADTTYKGFPGEML